MTAPDHGGTRVGRSPGVPTIFMSLIPDGRAVSRRDYPGLYEALGYDNRLLQPPRFCGGKGASVSELHDHRLEIVWEEPPETTRPNPRRLEWETTLARLTAHPGRWARIRSYKTKGGAASDRYRLVKGEIKHVVPKGRWEFEARQLPSGHGSALYCRYIGK